MRGGGIDGDSVSHRLGSRTCSARQVPWTCLKQRSKRHRRARRKSPENESHHRSRRTPHGWPAMSPYCARPRSRTPPVGGMVDSCCCLSLSHLFPFILVVQPSCLPLIHRTNQASGMSNSPHKCPAFSRSNLCATRPHSLSPTHHPHLRTYAADMGPTTFSRQRQLKKRHLLVTVMISDRRAKNCVGTDARAP